MDTTRRVTQPSRQLAASATQTVPNVQKCTYFKRWERGVLSVRVHTTHFSHKFAKRDSVQHAVIRGDYAELCVRVPLAFME